MVGHQVVGIFVTLLIGSILLISTGGPAAIAAFVQVLVAAAALANAVLSRKG